MTAINIAKVTEQEINRVIAKFMGLKMEIVNGEEAYVRNGFMLAFPYTKSLDSLVPVWRKLGLMIRDVRLQDDIDEQKVTITSILGDFEAIAETVQLAAAKATYLAVQGHGAE